MKVRVLLLLFGFLKSSEALVNIENPLFDQIMNRKVNELISETLKEYKNKIGQLEEHILKQEKRITVLEDGCKVKENKSLFTWRNPKIENIMRMADKAYNQKLNDKTAVKNDGVGQIERIRRDYPSAGQPVGFYAYMSGPENNPGTHHTLIFDVVKTNLGSAYSKFTGAFRAPVEGSMTQTGSRREHKRRDDLD
ncbi:uncharacterized protein LOC125649673 isoform X3 [Ostrea edulis]|uniref:uncharacterized protein LOC125649673 isoform X3 n=1 Tax=Ostrea edulis TaxID=37623 RepID=UPI0024AF294D|nr:uncharacterized protein LOC125649673 isoform X3 [Ostrea edulis]